MTNELNIIRTPKKQKGFQCPFCGSLAQNPEEYYSSLTTILTMRFIRMLRLAEDQTRQDAIMDCILAVFGPANPQMRTELECFGFLERFDQRYDEREVDMSRVFKIKCETCQTGV